VASNAVVDLEEAAFEVTCSICELRFAKSDQVVACGARKSHVHHVDCLLTKAPEIVRCANPCAYCLSLARAASEATGPQESNCVGEAVAPNTARSVRDDEGLVARLE